MIFNAIVPMESGSNSACVGVDFSANDWVSNENGYAFSIPKTQHKRNGNYGYQLWQYVDGAPVENTWAVIETTVQQSQATGDIVLKSSEPYAGVIAFFG